jgi:hypothetical protein
MNIPNDIRTHVRVLFTPLNSASAAHTMPKLGTLTDTLTDRCPRDQETIITLDPATARLFATAGVESWQRGVHSFLISCSLTQASPLWAAVTGYYASHYAMRAFAHILGHFVLYNQKLIVTLQLQNGAHICTATKKNGWSREHRYYWKIVKAIPCFVSDPLFTLNPDRADVSDVAHRSRANYADHVSQFPAFRALAIDEIRDRADQISSMEMIAPPILDRRNYPDVNAVQILAYHRLVRFRSFLNEILGSGNRFWQVNKNPAFASGVIDYQIVS